MSNPIKILGYKITSTITKGGRSVNVGYVDKTDVWTRPLLSDSTQKDFSEAVEKNIDSLAANATTVALQ